MDILIPRNIESRAKKRNEYFLRLLEKPVIDGDFSFEQWMLEIDINPDFVKAKTINGNLNGLAKNINIFPDWLGKIETVKGDCRLWWCDLISAKNIPNNIEGYLGLSNNKITSLEGMPQNVKKWINVSNNKLTSLKGIQPIIFNDLDCRYNIITDNYMPTVIGQTFKYCNPIYPDESCKLIDVKRDKDLNIIYNAN